MKFLKWDKFQHFAISFLLVIGLNLIFSLWLAVLIAFLLGLAKEIYDVRILFKYPKLFYWKATNFKDMLANILGIGVGVLILIFGG